MNDPQIDRNRDRFEVYNTIILAIATLSVAWCSYQGTLWNGIQTFRLAESNKYSRLAQQKLIQSGQNKAMEEAVIINFVDAVLNKDQKKNRLHSQGSSTGDGKHIVELAAISSS